MNSQKGSLFAIGDIHGHFNELQELIKKLENHGGLNQSDTIVFLGDYVNKGPDTYRVIEYLISLKNNYDLKILRGNHEIYFEKFLNHDPDLDWNKWIKYRPEKTFKSYIKVFDNNQLNDSKIRSHLENRNFTPLSDLIPKSHKQFLEEMLPYYECKLGDQCYFFTHGQIPLGYKTIEEVRSLSKVDPLKSDLYWGREKESKCCQISKVTFVTGHTPMKNEQIHPHVIYLDTGCVIGNRLTAMNIGDKTCYSVANWIGS